MKFIAPTLVILLATLVVLFFLGRYQTKKIETEKELINAKNKAEQSDILKSAFLANMSHEIRTPMNSILGFIQFLKNPGLSTEKRKGFVNIIEKFLTI